MKIRYHCQEPLQDYKISYMNEIQYHCQEPFTGLLDIICEYYYILQIFQSLI